MSFNIKKLIPIIAIVLTSILIFSYKITTIPPGLETDEGSIAYNSALISQTLRDQNNRFLPFFILSSDKIDWKQPVLIYFNALNFKIFGPSLLLFKLSNIIISLLSSYLIYQILQLLFKNKNLSLLGVLLYITTPIIIITTRITNESILPSLFSCLWILSLLKYKQTLSIKYLIMNALSLGIGFYSFKGMRIIVPIWTIISCFFILVQSRSQKANFIKHIFSKNFLKPITYFLIFLLPFFLISPILELKYAGAVFDRQVINIESLYKYLFYWLSNTSAAFWFTTPDIGKIYKVATFGALLLINLIPFAIGSFEALKNRSMISFVLLCFFLTPFLFGLADSLSYTHRLTASVPLMIILVINGLKSLPEYLKNKKHLKYAYLTFIFLLILNFFDFASFYYFKYPTLNDTQTAFGQNTNHSFKELSRLAKSKNLAPYIQKNIYQHEADENKFYNIVYFKNSLNMWELGEEITSPSVLLTENSSMDGFENSGIDLPHDFNILITK